MEKGCFFFEVGKGFLNVVQINFVFQRVNQNDIHNASVFQTSLITN
jgi:hypothetical protein